ncbi:MAG: aldehyde ferredoxin oxidoreductase [Slackia sp.]
MAKEDNVSFGWAGKIARVNLTTGAVTVESTDPYKQYIGGMGIANKIMYDEVPAGTDPLSPESKVIFAVGPLTASGVPLAGRTTLAHLSTFTKDHLVVDSHMGGMFGAKLKLAGWDALVVEGASDEPVFIKIIDDEITIESAEGVWGLGTRAATEALNTLVSDKACVATIGPAGENLLPYSNIINSRNHSAGAGVGAILGSKKCKGVVVEGNGSVYVKDPKAIAELSDYMLSDIIGSNNNHVVPSTQQEWAEFYDAGSRWTARDGLTWALAEGGPINTGEPKPGELNTVGYRCMKSTKDLGPAAEKYTVKMNGCHSCPIHCYSDLRVEAAESTAGFETVGNTCAANFPVSIYMKKILGLDIEEDESVLWDMTTQATMDNLGLWCNYAQLYRDIAHCYRAGVFEKNLPAEEYASINWAGFENDSKDPTVMVEILTKLAQNDSELSYIGYGPYTWCERWNDQEWFDTATSTLINYRGWPVHHAIECFGQVGAVYNMMFNRDDMIHSAVNFQGCGLPWEIKQQIAKEVWGSETAIDQDKNYTPMNEYKAKFCWWSIVTDVLHDCLTLCNWVWPMTMSPSKSRDYRGDLDLEAKFYTAVTGEEMTRDELYKRAASVMTLQRANTVRGMGTNDMRNEHDTITEWVFTKDPDIQPFTAGTDKMERDDFQTALGMGYKEFGWDEQTGAPTAACLDDYGMGDVKDELASLGLL